MRRGHPQAPSDVESVPALTLSRAYRPRGKGGATMLIEGYVALSLLVFLLIFAVLYTANREYQRARWTQRWEQRTEQYIDDEFARFEYLEAFDLDS
jgi:hypothetical protein